MRSSLDKRLVAVEAMRKSQLTRYFSGYVADDRYYEIGDAINYRHGLNGEPVPLRCFSRAELSTLESQCKVDILGVTWI